MATSPKRKSSSYPDPTSPSKASRMADKEVKTETTSNVATPPKKLASMKREDIEKFVEEMKEYIHSNQAKNIIINLEERIEPGVYQYISRCELHSSSNPITPNMVWDFLQNKAKAGLEDLDEIREALEKVSIDMSETSGKKKIVSLIISHENAISKLRLSNKASKDGICFTDKKQIKFLKKKLPIEFLIKLEDRLEFVDPSKDEFYEIILKLGENFNWENIGFKESTVLTQHHPASFNNLISIARMEMQHKQAERTALRIKNLKDYK